MGGARGRRGDSAHGGRRRASLAKNFLKRGGKPKNWGARGTERANLGTLYRTGSVLIDGRTSPHASSLTYPLPSTTQSNLSVCVHSPRPSTLTLRLRMNLCRILVMTIPIRVDRRPCATEKYTSTQRLPRYHSSSHFRGLQPACKFITFINSAFLPMALGKSMHSSILIFNRYMHTRSIYIRQ